ncbi:MAG: type I-F CRISPR-associated helicase Cas3 [Rhodocyclaceae bacterium]|nr:type I-F CRISPR-associated helicase Cas3 [Rhodocyclaceae bacterium]
MNVLLISQCSKNALAETRRILDQFAERRGDRTWQTPITHAGLETLHRLLRRTARKNTAVACHWIRGKDHSELLWIVGDARQFNPRGATPTNATRRNVLRAGDENDWHTAEDIRLLAQLAALLHDLGKASIAFQARLRGELSERNLYRHEWVSLRLFQAFVGHDDDESWLRRLADREVFDEHEWIASGRYQRDGLDVTGKLPFRDLPPLAAAVAWLVLTHHRLPLVPVEREDGTQDRLGKRARRFSAAWLETPLALVAHDWNEIRQPAGPGRIESYWQPADRLPVVEPKWRANAARMARRLFELRQRRDGDWLANTYVMHLARLSLMLADHYYSSLPADSAMRVKGDGNSRLYANTDSDGRLKQALDEHLIGVARDAGSIAHALPGFERYLPRLANHRGLRKRSGDARFAWQDKAADAAAALREDARAHGAFVVNMASTGCGKTLANARILYALADPQLGMRATYALGLRTLTLQTGRSFRKDLHLNEDELAIRVGGSASRALFEYYQEKAEANGSASAQALIEEDGHILYDGAMADHPLLARALHDGEISKLLSAPMLVCTVDHLVPATESLRAGRQIAPMLRLMSADLVLDELDDYDLDDLPALTRLVHWAGLLGTRVVLSSATLPPSLVEGMFMAYRAGRIQYRRNRGAVVERSAETFPLPCLWADEFGVRTASCVNADAFSAEHEQFIAKRAARLEKAEPLRRAELVPLELPLKQPKGVTRAAFAEHVRAVCLQLHGDHAETDPVSGKRVSFGLVRMANIEPLFDVAHGLISLGAPEAVRIHLCVYHARFPLVQRSAIEHQLDAAFSRRGDAQAVYHLPAVRGAIDAHPEHDHLFVVLASPICEVGRDWDADWAVVEPSSMRSLIQLAGRVQRHRRKAGDCPNLRVFATNLRHFLPTKGPDGRPAAIFVRPGFEKVGVPADHPYRLLAHRLGKLMAPEEYRSITALPRICPRARQDWQPKLRFSDLEQARVSDCMLPRSSDSSGDAAAQLNAASAWQCPQAALTGVLPQQQPFREDSVRSVTLALLPDEDGERLVLHRVEADASRRGRKLYVPVERSLRHDLAVVPGERIVPWGEFDQLALLGEQAEYLDLSLRSCAERLATVEVPDSTQGWRYHPWVGFSK